MVTWIVIGVVTLLIVGYLIGEYNALIELRENVGKAKANIDVLLKQRNEEIPKLVEVCKQYIKYEQATLEKLVQARQQMIRAQDSGEMKSIGEAESALRTSIGGLLAVAESYPDLKANDNYLKLSSRISELQDSISDRREFYNDQVTLNNARIQQIPAVWIAERYNFQPFKLLEFSERELADHDLKTLFEAP